MDLRTSQVLYDRSEVDPVDASCVMLDSNTNEESCCMKSKKRNKEANVRQDRESYLGENDSNKEIGVGQMEETIFYKVSQNPPLLSALVFAFQHVLVSVGGALTSSLILCDISCAREDLHLLLQLLCTTMFMSGLATVSMCTIGVRLPIFQGPATTYLVPLLALQNLDEWKCPNTVNVLDPVTNATVLMADVGNGTLIPNREISFDRLAMMSGSLIVAGILHFLVGISGLVGVFLKYIGPITIVPTVTLVALQFDALATIYCQTDWITAIVVSACCLILSLYLAKPKTPIPMWTRKKGFYIKRYPLHQVLSVLVAMLLGIALSAIFTYTKYYSDDPKSREFRARIDARSSLIKDADWFMLPYPGQYGKFSFNTGIFFNFLFVSIISIIDSIGDYAACARVSRAPPPPPFAFNRGLTVEGFMSALSGIAGCCHATISYGPNLGVLTLTKVASRRVFQLMGLIFIFLSVFGKFGAILLTTPDSVLGGTVLVNLGLFIGVMISMLQTVDLNSSRNVSIIGLTIMVGKVIPIFISNHPDSINTGNKDVDSMIRMLLSNPACLGGIFAFFLDNTVPGTLKERGLQAQMKDLDDEVDPKVKASYIDGPDIYRLPLLPDSFRKSRLAKLIPLFDLTSHDAKT